MPPRKPRLSREEIQLAVDKIVKKYDEYTYRFFKAPSLKLAFEERYFSALRTGADMQDFLSAEIHVIEDLIKKQEARLQKRVRTGSGQERPRGFADRVIEDMKSRIQKYDDIAFHRQANPEIRRLVGALSHMDEHHLTRLHDALRNTSYNYSSREMIDLDARLRDVAAGQSDVAPPRLTRYTGLLNAFPRDYTAIDREEKSFLLEAAYLLHDFRSIIDQVLETYSDMSQDSREVLLTVDDYLKGVIEDFRLKDFNRTSF